MRTKRKPELIQNAETALEKVLREFVEAKARIKDLEKVLAHHKAYIRSEMGEDGFIQAGDFYATLSIKSRSTLDAAGLKEVLDEVFLKKYTKTTTYETFEVKVK